MLEAELSAGGTKASSGAHQEVALPEVEPERRTNPKTAALKAKLKQPKTIVGAVIGVVAIAAVAFLVSRVMFSNSTDVWDGTSDTSWYRENLTSFTVTTAEQLAGIRELCNSGVEFNGVQFTLGRNLDLYDIKTKPIGDGRQESGRYHKFRGSFDGSGHTISGINIEEDMWDHAGLFGEVDGGDIRNLTVEGKVLGQVRVGGIVGEMDGGSLVNCTNRCRVASLKTATSYYPVSADVGGVCGIWLGISWSGKKEARLEKLVNEGDVSARACSAGGVIGTVANSNDFTVYVNTLENRGSVTVYCESDDRDEGVGGVIGVVGALGTDSFSGLVNNGEVSCSSVLCVGGVFGTVMAPQREQRTDTPGLYTNGVQIGGCTNTARVAANASDKRAHVGGIAGHVEDPDVTFEGCKNTGELAATNGNADDIAATDGAKVWDEWEDAHPKTW